MDIVVEKTKLDDNCSRAGLKCLLYGARKQPQFHFQVIKRLKADLHNKNPGMGISVLNPNENSCPDLVNTKFGKKCPVCIVYFLPGFLHPWIIK